jgi:hypothetical protein
VEVELVVLVVVADLVWRWLIYEILARFEMGNFAFVLSLRPMSSAARMNFVS